MFQGFRIWPPNGPKGLKTAPQIRNARPNTRRPPPGNVCVCVFLRLRSSPLSARRRRRRADVWRRRLAKPGQQQRLKVSRPFGANGRRRRRRADVWRRRLARPGQQQRLKVSRPFGANGWPHHLMNNKSFKARRLKDLIFECQGSRGRRTTCDFNFRAAVGAQFHPQGWVCQNHP